MPITRFFGYIDYMNRYYQSQKISTFQNKIASAKRLDWADEVRRIKEQEVN